MQINTSQVRMEASAEHRDVRERFGQEILGMEGGKPRFRLELPFTTRYGVERVAENRQLQEVSAASSVHYPRQERAGQSDAAEVMEQMVGGVVGQPVRLRRPTNLEKGEKYSLEGSPSATGQQVAFSFASHSLQYEYERVSVVSAGAVQLADGRSIDFSLELTMEREALLRESVAWQAAGQILTDPLVLNFDCDLRGVSNRRFQFDLDCDGEKDEICALPPGSGFLALDLNNDQLINNGRELFGPTTGHGFTELAWHDRDENGWIDENDPIFEKLRIWKEDGSGGSALLTLKEAGVGAICLAHDRNTFQLKDRENSLLGEVAASGLFLTEAGEVRPMQEIKFALEEEKEGDQAPFGREGAESEPLLFLRQMVAIRQAEVQALARHGLARREQQKERDLLAELFSDWRKEKGLASVLARKESLG